MEPRDTYGTAEFWNKYNVQMADRAWKDLGVQLCAGRLVDTTVSL